jgi:hypothetical protein
MQDMPSEDTARWTVTVSKESDLALRTFLGAKGMRKGDLSKFIEDAVLWRMFRKSVTEAREAFSDLSPDETQALVDEAVAAVRREHPTPQPR